MTLTSALTIRDVTFKNRMVVSPMCQYSLRDGIMGDWHMVHLGRFALGGFGAVIVEATGVTAEGRITYGCPGLWSDAHIPGLGRVADFLRGQGVVSGIQLAHAGRKASTLPPWRIGQGPEPDGVMWQPVAPSAEAHAPDSLMPRELTAAEIEALPQAFADAARRALAAGFDLVEIHGAHGYLLNQFLSPVANHRTDDWGGTRDNRMRLPLAVIRAVRAVWPADRPLFLRLSAVDGMEGGVTLEDSIAFCEQAAALGVDAFDVSATGFTGAAVQPGPGMFLGYATAIREATGKPVMAVGMMDDVGLAAEAVFSGRTDLVAIGRGALDDPNWAIHAALATGTPPRQAWTKQTGYALERRPVRSAK